MAIWSKRHNAPSLLIALLLSIDLLAGRAESVLAAVPSSNEMQGGTQFGATSLRFARIGVAIQQD
jgi:hypothetical protein